MGTGPRSVTDGCCWRKLRLSQRQLWTLVSSVLVFASSGCATLPIKDSMRKELAGHYILVHEDGYPLSVDGGTFRRKPEEHFDRYLDRMLRQIDEHAAKVKAEGRPCYSSGDPVDSQPCLRLLLFVHGGLNGYRDDFERMKLLLIGDAKNGTEHRALLPSETSTDALTSYYPIFINWNSSLGDSITDDLFFIRFGRRNPWTGIPTAPFVFLRRAAVSVFGAPVAWTHTFDNFLDGWSAARATGDGWWDVTRDGLDVTFWAVPRILTTPVIEGFGTPAWQIMKRRAHLVAANRLADEPRAREGAGRTLMKAIQARVNDVRGLGMWKNSDGAEVVRVEITLVGHSMGAIVLNRLLGAVHTLPVSHVVYLAPAAGIDEVEGFIIPYMTHHKLTRFSWFSLGRRDEARESYYIAPRGSLLAWIDGLFEPGWTVGQMTQGRATNVLAYYQVDLESRDHQIYDGLWHGRLAFKKLGPAELAQAPFDLGHVSVYVARRIRDEAPRTHSDFGKPKFLGQVLCWIDKDAFRSPSSESCATPQNAAAPSR